MENWSAYLTQVAGLKEKTAATYRRWVDQLLEHAQSGPDPVDGPEQLGAMHLESLLRRLALDGHLASMGIARSAARSWGEYLELREVRAANPFARVRAPRRYAKEAPSLTVGEARRLVYGARPGYLPESPIKARNRVLVGVMYFAGLRVSEPARLRASRLQRMGDGHYSVLVEDGKWASEDVRLGIHDPIVGLYLSAWTDVLRQRFLDGVESEWLFPSNRGGCLSDMQVTRIFRAEVQAAGIEPRGRRLSPHILRHSIATHLDARDNEREFIQDWMRHRSESTTLRYIHPRRARARDVFRGRRSPLAG